MWIYNRPTHSTNMLADMEWAITSPPILHTASNSKLIRTQSKTIATRMVIDGYLPKLSCNLSEEYLQGQWEKEKDKRLGHYFEWLLHQWITSTHDNVIAGIQVFNNEITIGELDFILYSKHHIIHWEVAVKFMLAPRFNASIKEIKGINTKDTLEKKWHHMTTTQRSLIHQLSPEIEGTRDKALPSASIHQMATIKGWIFYPLSEWAHGLANLEHNTSSLNPSHLRGWWCEQHELDIIEKYFSGWKWIILPKQEWLGWGDPIKKMSKITDLSFKKKSSLLLGQGKKNQWTLLMLLSNIRNTNSSEIQQ